MGQAEETTSIKLFGTVILKVEKKDALEEEEAAAVAAAVPLECPRCKSRETKFCYFNNYNMNQPRHFCKACHRYWTAGGALRNVPVGAGRRRGRPAPSSGAAATAAACVLGYPSSPSFRNAGGRWLLRSDESARTCFGSVGGGESC